jgi:HNH endonuclease
MVSTATRKFVRQRARCLCEYCHSPEYLSPDRFTIDHIFPQSLGGLDDEENLALACHRCNERHYNFTTGIDPETKQSVPLFNPRQCTWTEHFTWTKEAQRAQSQRLNRVYLMNGALYYSYFVLPERKAL